MLFLQIIGALYLTMSRAVFAYTSVEVFLASRMIAGFIQTSFLGAVHPSCKQINQRAFWDIWNPKTKLLKVLVLGTFGITLYSWFGLLGVKYVGSTVTAAMICSSAVITPIVSAIFSDEKLTLLKAVSAVVALGGDIMLLEVWSIKTGGAGIYYVYGILAAVACVLSFSTFLVISKPLLVELPSFFLLKYYFAVASVGGVILSVTANDPKYWNVYAGHSNISPLAIGGFVFGLAVMTGIPYIGISEAFKLGMTSVAQSLWNCMSPVFAAIFSYAFYGIAIDGYVIGGIVIVFIAVAIGAYDQTRTHAAAVSAAAAAAVAAAAAAAAADAAAAAAAPSFEPPSNTTAAEEAENAVELTGLTDGQGTEDA